MAHLCEAQSRHRLRLAPGDNRVGEQDRDREAPNLGLPADARPLVNAYTHVHCLAQCDARKATGIEVDLVRFGTLTPNLTRTLILTRTLSRTPNLVVHRGGWSAPSTYTSTFTFTFTFTSTSEVGRGGPGVVSGARSAGARQLILEQRGELRQRSSRRIRGAVEDEGEHREGREADENCAHAHVVEIWWWWW